MMKNVLISISACWLTLLLAGCRTHIHHGTSITPAVKVVVSRSIIYGHKTNATDDAAMVWVPGGTFTMGCPASMDGGVVSMGETQQVTLSGYWIYKNEVTVAQYRAFCSATGHALPVYPSARKGNKSYKPWSQNVDWTGMAGHLQ